MEINLQNIEEVIFYDKKIHSLFPEFRRYFDQWALGKRISGMNSLGQRSMLELLNSLEESHILKLKDYFNDIVVVEKTNHKLVDFYDFELESTNTLCKYTGFKDFCAYRDDNQVYICLWR